MKTLDKNTAQGFLQATMLNTFYNMFGDLKVDSVSDVVFTVSGVAEVHFKNGQKYVIKVTVE